MALDVGDVMGPNALVGSVLFVGTGPALAQDNADFYYDPATNTLKTKDQTTAATSNFALGTGTVTTGNGSSGSGTVTVQTGGGQPNSSGSGSAGNSGTVTLSTGPGGAASGGSNPGVSGNLLLKTGTGGGNAAASSTGGNAGHIILQPGSGGTGTSATGAGGSTIVRASTNGGNVFAVQDSAGSTTYWSVANTGVLSGTLNNTASASSLTVNSQGVKTATFAGVSTNNTATSTTASISKAGLTVYSTGNWSGTNAVNYALYCTATGGTKNYAGYFLDGNVTVKNGNLGAGVDDPGARLHIAAGTSSVAPLKLTAGTNLTSPQAGAVEFDGTNLVLTRSDGTRRSLTNNVVNVLDFGAVGDGNADDSQAFRDAVASFVSAGVAGVIWVPPEFIYAIGSKVLIQSNYPIWIVSRMFNHNLPGAAHLTFAGSAMIRPKNNLDYMFEWDRPSIDPDDLGGGGGIEGIVFADWTGFNQTAQNRQFDIEAAVHVKRVPHFTFRDVSWLWLKGRAAVSNLNRNRREGLSRRKP
ncbi:MAG: glycosyl hydrolase family 28-related protein, partial [Pirellulales bacterium]